jgi:hypothetical protein
MGAGEGKVPPPVFEWEKSWHLPSKIREALFDTTAVFFVKSGAANATPHLRGLYLASVARFAQLIATWYAAEELASRAMLFLETPCERRPAIASPDVG